MEMRFAKSYLAESRAGEAARAIRAISVVARCGRWLTKLVRAADTGHDDTGYVGPSSAPSTV